jgi:hypothetical protein
VKPSFWDRETRVLGQFVFGAIFHRKYPDLHLAGAMRQVTVSPHRHDEHYVRFQPYDPASPFPPCLSGTNTLKIVNIVKVVRSLRTAIYISLLLCHDGCMPRVTGSRRQLAATRDFMAAPDLKKELFYQNEDEKLDETYTTRPAPRAWTDEIYTE